jgi:hypothetical protein
MRGGASTGLREEESDGGELLWMAGVLGSLVRMPTGEVLVSSLTCFDEGVVALELSGDFRFLEVTVVRIGEVNGAV